MNARGPLHFVGCAVLLVTGLLLGAAVAPLLAQTATTYPSPISASAPAPVLPLPGRLLITGDAERTWAAAPTLSPLLGPTGSGAFWLWTHDPAQRLSDWESLSRWGDVPRAVSATPASAAVSQGQGPVLFVYFSSGRFATFSHTETIDSGVLPAGQTPLAAVGSAAGEFVLTRSTFPATTRPAGTQPPETRAAGEGGAAGAVYQYVIDDTRWKKIADLGEGSANWPAEAERPTLGYAGGQLILAWRPTGDPTRLRVRQLDPSAAKPAWGDVVESSWGAGGAADDAELTPLNVSGQTLLVSAKTDRAGNVALHGGTLDPAGHFTTNPAWDHAPAPALGDVPDAPFRVALGQVGDCVGLSVVPADGHLTTRAYTAGGQPVGPAEALVPPPSPPPAGNTIPGIMMMALVLLLAISVWQRRGSRRTLPENFQVAPLASRLAAAAVDIALPLAAVALLYHLYSQSQWQELGQRWLDQMFRLEGLLHLKELLWLFGLYVAHVTLEELFFGASLGKALFGLRVVTLDGKRPPVGAIVLRNLIRVFELFAVPLLIIAVVTDYRQRLGDLLSRTVVVRRAAPVAIDRPRG